MEKFAQLGGLEKIPVNLNFDKNEDWTKNNNYFIHMKWVIPKILSSFSCFRNVEMNFQHDFIFRNVSFLNILNF
jgi:hypothetical protein